jgi:glycerol uptake facilitator-like aquaporin
MVRKEVPDLEKNTVEPTFYLKLFCEFIGTFGLSYTVAMTAASSEAGGLAPLPVPFCAACYLILMVYGIGSVSGCHINPAVSTAVFGWQCMSDTNPDWAVEFVAYAVTQTLGGMCGACFGAWFWTASNKYDIIYQYGVFPYRGADESAVIAMVTEMIALFFFTFGILRVCCDHDKPPMCTDGIVIGIALFTGIVGTASVSGGGVNPAVATSLVIANYYLEDEYDHASPHWSHGTLALVYWFGPMVGAFLAACTHYIIEVSTSREFVPYAMLTKDNHLSREPKTKE